MPAHSPAGNPSVADLVQRLQRGDAQAAALIHDRYVRQLCRFAEQHLSRKLAGRLDGEDIVQSVFRTFFRRSADGEFAIDTSGQLWRLLAQITRRKAQAAGRFHTARGRNVAAELLPNEPGLPEPVSAEADPAEAAALVDEVETLLRGLPPHFGQLLEARLQGRAVPEIACQMNVSRRTVQRGLRLLEQRLDRSAIR